MSKTWHGVLQVVAVVLHAVNVSALPAKYQPAVANIVGTLQAILALYNHNGDSNAK